MIEFVNEDSPKGWRRETKSLFQFIIFKVKSFYSVCLLIFASSNMIDFVSVDSPKGCLAVDEIIVSV